MAALAPTLKDFGLFSDEVYSSSDLNRRAGEVLDHARERPVTISRNREQFALLKREQVAKLIQTSNHFGPIVELVVAALSIAEGKEPQNSLAWLKAFDVGDLRKMIREVLVASSQALRDKTDWEPVHAIIYEWHESALLAMSGVFEEMMATPSEEVPLPDPRTVEPENRIGSASQE
jgi:hypothetical protein